MSYRAARGGRAGRRAAHKASLFEAKVEAEVYRETRAWLAAHPPHVAAPIELGRWRDYASPEGPALEVRFCGMHRDDVRGWVPDAPIVNVGAALRREPVGFGAGHMSPFPPGERIVQMRPISMRCCVGVTEIRWYNWEPVQGAFGKAEADIYSAAGHVLAFTRQLRALFDAMPRSEFIRIPFGGHVRVSEAVGWFDDFVTALEQWHGHVKSFYSLPGECPGDPSETHEARVR